MKTWLMLLLVVAIAAAIILGLAFLSSLAILQAGKRYLKKQQQQDADRLMAGLPGTDCGECGLESCKAFARQTAENHGFCEECPYLDPKLKEQLEAEFAQRQTVLQDRITRTKENMKK